MQGLLPLTAHSIQIFQNLNLSHVIIETLLALPALTSFRIWHFYFYYFMSHLKRIWKN